MPTAAQPLGGVDAAAREPGSQRALRMRGRIRRPSDQVHRASMPGPTASHTPRTHALHLRQHLQQVSIRSRGAPSHVPIWM